MAYHDERKEIIYFRKNFGFDIKDYILSNHEIIDEKHTDIIQYPKIIRKLISKQQNIEYKEIIINRKSYYNQEKIKSSNRMSILEG